MTLTVAHITPLVSLLAGFLILVAPSLLNYCRALFDCCGRRWPERNLSFCELIYTRRRPQSRTTGSMQPSESISHSRRPGYSPLICVVCSDDHLQVRFSRSHSSLIEC